MEGEGGEVMVIHDESVHGIKMGVGPLKFH